MRLDSFPLLLLPESVFESCLIWGITAIVLLLEKQPPSDKVRNGQTV